MKKTLTTLAISFVCFCLFSQSNIRINNFWDNTYYVNPASVTDNCFAEFTMATRKQWFNFPGSPTTYFGTATSYIKRFKAQVGVKVVQDKTGYTSATDIDFTYAYATWLDRDWRLHLGIGGSVQTLSYDVSKMVIATSYDPSTFDKLLNESNLNSDIGVELASESWTFGASSQNLLSLFNSINNQFSNTNIVYGTYRQNSKNLINMGGGIAGIQYGKMYQMELSVMTYFNATRERNRFQLGAFYRTKKEMGVLFGIDLTKTIRLNYSYDYNIGGIGRSSRGTNEIMLVYKPLKNWGCIMCDY